MPRSLFEKEKFVHCGMITDSAEICWKIVMAIWKVFLQVNAWTRALFVLAANYTRCHHPEETVCVRVCVSHYCDYSHWSLGIIWMQFVNKELHFEENTISSSIADSSFKTRSHLSMLPFYGVSNLILIVVLWKCQLMSASGVRPAWAV